MKSITLAVLFFFLQLSVAAQSATREECLPIEELAEEIMTARQYNINMSDIMYRYRDSEAAQLLIVRAFDRHILASSERVQNRIIQEFKSYAFLQCIKGTLTFN